MTYWQWLIFAATGFVPVKQEAEGWVPYKGFPFLRFTKDGYDLTRLPIGWGDYWHLGVIGTDLKLGELRPAAITPAEAQAWADAEIEKRERYRLCIRCGKEEATRCTPEGVCEKCWQEIQPKPKPFGPGTRLVAPNGDEIVIISDLDSYQLVNLSRNSRELINKGMRWWHSLEALQNALAAAGYRVVDDE